MDHSEETSSPTLIPIAVEEVELNKLFKELLDGIRDDITEAQENVDMYYDALVNSDTGKEAYGMSYNDALKIKGLARTRQLTFLNMFKERVSNKEKMQMDAKKNVTEGTSFNHSELNKMIEEIESGKNKPIKISNKKQVEIDIHDADDEDVEIYLGDDEEEIEEE